MDIIYRLTAETKTVEGLERKYVGQTYDSLATTIHFEYDPLDFISSNGYVPYIQFGVYDDSGAPLVYSLNSTPKFDGYEFTIPWDVTSRVKTKTLNFQLFYVKNNVTVNDVSGVTTLDSTEYFLFPVAGIALKDSIKCRPMGKGCCPPQSAPTTEPNILGYINLFREQGIVLPVKADIDKESNRLVLTFQTYNGTNDQQLALDVPYIEDGKIPAEFFNGITEWGEESDENFPTAKLVKTSLDAKADKDLPIPEWDSEVSYIAGAIVIYDGKVWISKTTGNVGNEPAEDDHWYAPIDGSIVISEWSENPSSSRAPSEALVKEALDAKADKYNPISGWDSSATYSKDSLVIDGGKIYISLVDSNIGHDPAEGGVWWTQIQGSGGGSSTADYDTVSSVIGNGEDTVFVVTHDFGTYDVFVQLRMAEGDMDLVDARIAVPTENEVSVSFSEPIETNSVIVTITPMIAPDKGYIGTIGNGEDTVFDVVHHTNTLNFFCQLRTNDEDRRLVRARVRPISRSTARISFTSPPPQDGIVVMISPAIGSDAKDQGFVYHQSEPATVWTVEHGFGRFVSVMLYDEDGEQVIADVKMVDEDTVQITYGEESTGYAVIN